jgi:DNA-binding beta-propeller fold protein YncE/plastocyanin
MKQGMRGKMTVLPGSDDLPIVGAVFTLSDEPGLWMKTLDAGIADDLDNTLASLGLPATARNGTGFPISYISDALTPVGGNTDFSNSQGRSLAVIQQNQTVIFGMKDSQTKHTITTLVYPTNAPQIGGNGILRAGGLGHYDQQLGIRGSAILTDETGSPVGLTEPGLYAFVCKIHPYMFGAVIVDDPKTNLYIGGDENKPFPLLDLSPDLTALIRTGDPDPAALDFPTSGISPTSGLAGALLTTVYTITDPNNWKDYNEDYWNVSLPPVLVTTNTTDIAVGLVYDDAITAAAVSALDLRNTTSGIDYPATLGLELGKVNEPIPAIHKPDVKGIGEVWVNTQFERTLNKNFDGTPFDKPGTITVVNAEHWNVKKKISLPEINMNHPHNMWSDKKNEIIYQTEWFGNEMAVIDRDTGELIKEVFTGQSPSHVMTAPDTDKIYIAVNGEDTVTEFNPLTYEMERQISTGFRSHPHGHWIDSEGDYIVTPDFLGLKASIIDMSDDDDITVTNSSTILYGPIATGMKTNLDTTFYTADFLGNTMSAIDYTTGEVLDQIDLLPYGLPIQTPISPDNKWMVTALTLGAKIAVIDVTTTPGTVVDYLECDPGCHGVQWGAKEGGGYLAYVSSKFSNVLTVVDPDPAGDGTVDPVVAGHIKLANDHADNDDPIIGYQGMGGQGVLAIPNVYDGWIQQTVEYWDDVECDVPKGPKSQGQGDPQGKGPNCEIKDYLEQLDYYQKNP